MTTSSVPSGLIGWALNSSRSIEPIYHIVSTRNPDGTGVSVCGTNLVETSTLEFARRYERVCLACSRPQKPPPAKRLLVEARPQVAPLSRAPLQPEHIRVDPDGRVVIQVGGHRWVVLDVATGTITGEVTNVRARKYPTLRSLVLPADLLGTPDLAAEWGMSVTAVSQLLKRRDDFPAPDVRLGGHAGWFLERLPELNQWYANRGGRTGGGRPPGKAKRRTPKRS